MIGNYVLLFLCTCTVIFFCMIYWPYFILALTDTGCFGKKSMCMSYLFYYPIDKCIACFIKTCEINRNQYSRFLEWNVDGKLEFRTTSQLAAAWRSPRKFPTFAVKNERQLTTHVFRVSCSPSPHNVELNRALLHLHPAAGLFRRQKRNRRMSREGASATWPGNAHPVPPPRSPTASQSAAGVWRGGEKERPWHS